MSRRMHTLISVQFVFAEKKQDAGSQDELYVHYIIAESDISSDASANGQRMLEVICKFPIRLCASYKKKTHFYYI